AWILMRPNAVVTQVSFAGTKSTLPLLRLTSLPSAKLSVVAPRAALAAGITKEIGRRSARFSTGTEALLFGAPSISARILVPSKRTIFSGSKSVPLEFISREFPVSRSGSAARGATAPRIVFARFAFDVFTLDKFSAAPDELKTWWNVGTFGIDSA